LARLEGEHVHIIGRSSFYQTEPQDVRDQPWFLNLVAVGETSYFPLQLLAILQRIEHEGGRTRGGRPKGPRLIDLDLLLYGDNVIETPQLTVPHPRMLERRFVLEPLLEIAPDLRHPLAMRPLRSYLKGIAGQRLRKLAGPQSDTFEEGQT
jgi:2-amino-4-hydroxy-6-hydroxymethyldihydropteridine diphosphokinase